MAAGDPCDVCGGPIPRGSGPRKRCSIECRRAFAHANQRRMYQPNPKAIEYMASYRARHPERYAATLANRPSKSYDYRRANGLRVHYGLTVAEYDAMVVAQDGRCAICKRVETRRNRGRPLPLSVDHDHETGAVRGLLCGRCNSVLGFFEEPELFTAATDYLRRHTSAKEAIR